MALAAASCLAIVLFVTTKGAEAARDDQYSRYTGPQTFGSGDGSARVVVNQPTPVRFSAAPDGPRAPPPAILTHKQGLTNEGVFNYVFAADNGLKQGESIAPDGTRTGAYEYVDPNGKTIFVKYTAGKDGFKILEGDHIPLQPQAVKPIPEFQPPEYREKLLREQQQQQQGSNGKYKTETEDYEAPPEKKYYQPRNKPVEPQQERQQRYQIPQKQQQQQQQPIRYFQPDQQQQRGYGRQGADADHKAMLYNVEQRHAVNYRKYQDNGQPIGSEYDGGQAGAENAPHAHGTGYNFEFKG